MDNDDKDPLDWLDDGEAAVMALAFEAIEAILKDKELANDIIGCALVTIDEWGQTKNPDKPPPNRRAKRH